MIPDTKNKKQKTATAGSERLVSEFISGADVTEANDPFFRWLQDVKSVRIDWSNFGIEKIRSKKPRKI